MASQACRRFQCLKALLTRQYSNSASKGMPQASLNVSVQGLDTQDECSAHSAPASDSHSGHDTSATGYSSASSATGDSSASSASGNAAVALNTGRYGKSRAGAGGAIVICNHDDEGNLRHIFSSKVGENGIEPDTFYTLGDDGVPKVAA